MFGNKYKTEESLYNDDPVIRTYSGKYVDVFNLKEEDICIEDIAHALTTICRFGGHTKYHYSVAEHTIWMTYQASDEFKLDCLLHDASEAYIGDIPRPIKKHLPYIKELETQIQTTISKKFNVQYPFVPEVHTLDNLALEHEWENVKLKWSIPKHENLRFFHNHKIIYNEFLRLFKLYER